MSSQVREKTRPARVPITPGKAALIVGGDVAEKFKRDLAQAIDEHKGAWKVIASRFGISVPSLYRILRECDLTERMKNSRRRRPMQHRVLTPDRNTSSNDFTGAFQPESQRYASHFRDAGETVTVSTVPISAQRHTMRESVNLLLSRASGQIDTLVFMCHGWPDGIQLGYHREDCASLAQTIAATCAESPLIVLYCCSTGSDVLGGAGSSFAGVLRDQCRALGRYATVFAHTTAGHTTRNPNIRLFHGWDAGWTDLLAPRDLMEDRLNPYRWDLPRTMVQP